MGIFLTIPKYSVRGKLSQCYENCGSLAQRIFSGLCMVDLHMHIYYTRNQYIQLAMAFIEIEIEKAREKPEIKMISFTAHLYNDNKYIATRRLFITE